jgi:hypothetical protein
MAVKWGADGDNGREGAPRGGRFPPVALDSLPPATVKAPPKRQLRGLARAKRRIHYHLVLLGMAAWDPSGLRPL